MDLMSIVILEVKLGVSKKVSRLLKRFPVTQFICLRKYCDGMMRMHYGFGTISSYTVKLARILQYVGTDDLENVTADQVNRYLSMRSKQNVSHSLLNQVHSAVRLYHLEIANNQDFELDKLKRPKQPFKVTEIFK